MKKFIINTILAIIWYPLLIIGHIPARIALKIWSWKIEGDIPKLKKMMIIVTPHRKGFEDFLLGLFTSMIKFTPPVRFLAKYEAMHPWWNPGKILYLFGAIPIDRKHQYTDAKKGDVIGTMIRTFQEESRAIFVIVPEGTRKEGEEWKRGFYETAYQAGVEVVPVGFDYLNKIVKIGKPIKMTGNVGKDLELLKEWYMKNIPGYVPNINIQVFKPRN